LILDFVLSTDNHSHSHRLKEKDPLPIFLRMNQEKFLFFLSLAHSFGIIFFIPRKRKPSDFFPTSASGLERTLTVTHFSRRQSKEDESERE
jgi:hypothetical protein